MLSTEGYAHPLRPCGGGTHQRQFGFHVGGNAGIKFAVVVEDTQCVFSHFLAGEEFHRCVGKVESQLQALAIQFGTKFEVGQQ